MATHSSVLAWRIPGTGESGGLPSILWQESVGRGVGQVDSVNCFSSLYHTLLICKNEDLSLPLGLALGSPIFPSGCEGKLGGGKAQAPVAPLAPWVFKAQAGVTWPSSRSPVPTEG